jgi:hypothetical protein
MLGSAHPGERDAAAVLATKLLTAHQLSWDQLLRPPAPPTPPAPVPAAAPRTWRIVVEEIVFNHYGALFESEVRLTTSMLEKGFAPSPKQTAWLLKICRRAGVRPWENWSAS